MIISIDEQNTFYKFKYLFFSQNTEYLRQRRRPSLNLTMGTYETSTANIILNGQRLEYFPLRSGIRQGCLFLITSPTFYWGYQPLQ